MSDTSKNNNRWPYLIILLLILACAGWLRYNHIEVPLERDEGEYAYGGQLLLQGIPPYSNLYNMKLPGIYAAYAILVALFGQTHTGIHLGLLVVNLLAGAFIYLLTEEIAGKAAGLAAAAAFSLISIGQPVQGIFANSEHFVILPMIFGGYLLLKSRGDHFLRVFLAGLCMGLAFLIKQHGIFFILAGGFFVLIDSCLKKPLSLRSLFSRLAAYSIGVFLPYIVTCLLLWKAGVFNNFWFWTVEYARSYTAQTSWAGAWVNFKFRARDIFSAAPAVWLVVIAGLPVSIFVVKNIRHRLFVWSFVLFSFFALCPGLYFRPHYFVLFLPAAALLFGLAVGAMVDLSGWRKSAWRYAFSTILVFAVISVSIYKQRDFLFKMSPEEITRATYWPNPFSESLAIAKFIKEQTKETDRIAVIGSEPQIYFYANRKSASGYIYMYPLMENHDFALKMQEELIKEIEEASPEIMVFVRVDLSWLQNKDSHTLIYKWFQQYKENYERIGTVEIYNNSSLYFWTPQVKWPPTTPYWLEILKRKS